MFRSILEREKSRPQIVGARKKRMTAIWSQKKMFPSVLEKKFNPYYLEPPNCNSQHFEASKKRTTAISSQKNLFSAIWSKKKWIPANCKLKILVYSYYGPEKLLHSYLEQEKNASQLFGS